MNHCFCTFDDWVMVIDRWQELPPPSPNFLQTTPVWIQIHKILINYYTLKNIKAVPDAVGYTKNIEYDEDKHMLQEYQPVKDTKMVNLRKGGSAIVDVEYERFWKKCFQCLRGYASRMRSNDVPFSKATKTEEGRNVNGLAPVLHKQHHSDMVHTLMLILKPSVPPGFEPTPNVVAPKVWEQMKLYMNYTNPEERKIREFRMKEALKDLSRNIVVQSSYLKLQDSPVISKHRDSEVGRVFRF
ncbi:hypothetical protein N665_0023s0009 [Sinapis alba]|nr:hypothetical protein N665_0023s0009 [Sinapis alba]